MIYSPLSQSIATPDPRHYVTAWGLRVLFSHPDFAALLLVPGTTTESGLVGMQWKFALLQAVYITYSEARRGGAERRGQCERSWLSAETWDEILLAIKAGPYRCGHKAAGIATKRL